MHPDILRLVASERRADLLRAAESARLARAAAPRRALAAQIRRVGVQPRRRRRLLLRRA
jgi:hypothetical protein